jgi:hypothetical protein
MDWEYDDTGDDAEKCFTRVWMPTNSELPKAVHPGTDLSQRFEPL